MIYFTTIWQLIALSTFWCVGVYMTSRDKGDIFYFLNAGTKGMPAFIHKPIISCINCMSSWHSAVVMVLYFALAGYVPPIIDLLFIWLIVAVITAGTNGIVWVIYRYFEIFCILNKDAGKEIVEERRDSL